MAGDGKTARWWGWPRSTAADETDKEEDGRRPPKWSMGVLNDKHTVEVPGSVLLLAKDHNEPLGLRVTPARTSHSSLPTSARYHEPAPPPEDDKKKTDDGKIILEPQPEDSANDPLNWSPWRRDLALLSLGLFCMVGGGMTPILAAGYNNVAQDYDMSVSQVSYTVGLFMTGMGIGSVIFSPTAILYGKRPVYLFGAVIFVIASVWCALSPNFASLILARIFQGIAVSPVECLPSATIAEIFFLHERAFRIGIYTLLLLGGKNLVPLVSAAVIQRLGWRWVFWIVAMVVAFCGALLFLFVPETFWDRAPVPRSRKPSSNSRPNFFRRLSSRGDVPRVSVPIPTQPTPSPAADEVLESPLRHPSKNVHVGFAPDPGSEKAGAEVHAEHGKKDASDPPAADIMEIEKLKPEAVQDANLGQGSPATLQVPGAVVPGGTPSISVTPSPIVSPMASRKNSQHFDHRGTDSEKQSIRSWRDRFNYTNALRDQPAKSFVQQLKPFHGRLKQDKWHKVAMRPFILYTYPAVLWSAVVYSCSVGWLIVLSESVSVIYRNSASYNFTALQAGLVYISPFVGGILGTAVAGKVSDVIVKAMARNNGGLYEPEFRLVMVIPILITTVIGLMGFGWSAQERDAWIVPTVFFGIISFGCSLGSTTSITFCVDSYRQYAGEALVTLNFSKNIFHGLIFSLFVTEWITSDGPKSVFIWIGVIQLILLMLTVPMFLYGKRARMWTVRKNLMEKF